MNPDLLRKAAQRVREITAANKQKQEDEEITSEALYLAVQAQMNDALINAVENAKIDPEAFAEVFKDAVREVNIQIPEIVIPQIDAPSVSVNVPDVIVPEIVIPPINVPEPKVTVNVPEMKVPEVNIPPTEVNFPERMDVNVENNMLKVMTVDPKGNFISPAQASSGPRHVKATLQEGSATIGNVTVQAADSASIDAFGRLRMSEVETIFDSKQIFDSLPLFYDDQEVSGSGTSSTHNANQAATEMAVSASTAGKRVRQSFMRMNYQPGKSQLILCTGTLGAGGTGITAAMGYFDDNNGLFAMSKDGEAYFVKRSSYTGSAVDTEVAQANWNIDPFDGTGPSGVILDPTKSQILWIDFEWLGVGRVRMGWVIDGKIYYAHEFLHSNHQAGVYMSTPNLPIRYEIENDGTGGAATMQHICASVMSEGGVQNNGYLRHYDSGAVSSLSAGTAYAIMGGKLKDTHLGATVLVENLSVIGSANDQAHWELRIGGAVATTVSGPFAYTEISNSAVKVATGHVDNVITGGTEIDGGYFSTTQGVTFTVPNALHLGAAIDGTPQEWQLVCIPITNNITVRASVTWRELL